MPDTAWSPASDDIAVLRAGCYESLRVESAIARLAKYITELEAKNALLVALYEADDPKPPAYIYLLSGRIPSPFYVAWRKRQDIKKKIDEMLGCTK